MTEAAIRVDDLTVVRGGRRVIDRVGCDIPAGSVTGLLGPSGSGKTTLLRCVLGIQRHVTGTVRVLGEPAGTRGLRSRVGYASQAASVYADLTVLENLRYFAAALRVPRTQVERVLETVELVDHADRLAGSLSGGQHSRVSLGVAMLGSPELLVLDEPTVGLDPVLREQLWGAVPPPRRRRHHPAGVQPRDGRGGAVRHAAAVAGGAGARSRGTRCPQTPHRCRDHGRGLPPPGAGGMTDAGAEPAGPRPPWPRPGGF